jgi:hypothetical protein
MSGSIDAGLDQVGWYQSQATRVSAEEFLMTPARKVRGNFVVRPSSMAEALALSVVVENGTVAHSIIRRTPEGFVVKLDDEVSPAFPSVRELLESIKPHVEVSVALGLLNDDRSVSSRLRAVAGNGGDGGGGDDSSFESESADVT